jgi:hypothetical protein
MSSMIEILLVLFFGHTTTDWIIQWFHWIMPFPPNDSPTLDQTGNLTMKYQPNNLVYMLPGEHSAVASNRNITIPPNKPIMMPVLWFINGTYSSVVDDSFVRKANEFFAREVPTKLFASLDGKQLPITNVTTPVFRLNIPKQTAFGEEEEHGGDAWLISRGYWVFLDPLPPGNHTLTYLGATHNYVNGATFYLKVLG